MSNSKLIPGKKDRGGRRLGVERRVFTLGYSHERRSGQERRGAQDRRTKDEQGNPLYARRSMDRYMEFVSAQKGLAYGLLFSLPIWALIILFLMGKL